MTKVVLNVPWTDSQGETHAAGSEVDVSEEEATALRADGKGGPPYEPPREPGNYGARTSRSDAGTAQAEQRQQPEHPRGGPPGQTGDHPRGGPPGQDKPRADQDLPPPPSPTPREDPKKK